MIDRWIAEATEYDFKVALEIKKPKSWLKSEMCIRDSTYISSHEIYIAIRISFRKFFQQIG